MVNIQKLKSIKMLHTIKKMMWVVVIGILSLGKAISQPTAITLTNSPYTQNFNSIGSGVPSGWGGISGEGSTSTSLMGTLQTPTLAATAWSNTGSGFFNYASTGGLTATSSSTAQGSSSNRSFGFQTTGSNDSLNGATPVGNGSFVFRIQNTLGYTNMNASFNILQLNNAAGRSIRVIYQVASGNNPATLVWKTITSTGVVNAPGHVGYVSTNVTNGTWGTQSVSLNSSQLAEIENKSTNVWFRVFLLRSTGSNNRPKIAIDDFNLSWTSTPAKVSLSNLIPSTPNITGSFSVTASILNNEGGPAPSASSRTVTLSTTGGTGNLTGTLTSTVAANQYQTTFTGLNYDVAEDVILNVNSPSLTAGTLSITVAAPPANEPSTQATSASTTAPGFNSLTLGFTTGDGNRRIVVARQGSSVTATPSDGFAYTPNSNFGTGSELTTGQFVVYDGTGNSVTVNQLKQNTTYHFAVYEYNTNGSGTQNYLTSTPATATGTTTSQSLTAGDLAIVGFRGSTADGISVVALVDLAGETQFKFTDNSWTSTNTFLSGETVWTWQAPISGVSKGTVIRLEGGVVSVGSILSGGTVTGIGNTGDNIFIYTGPDATPNFIYGIANTPFITTGTATASNSYLPAALTLGTTAVSSATNFFNGRYNITSICGNKSSILTSVSNTINWFTSNIDDPATLSIATSNFGFTVDNFSVEPTATPIFGSFTSITPGGMTANWTTVLGAGSHNILVVREGSPVTFVPTDGLVYAANASFGSGTNLGSSQYIVYNGIGNTVTITSMAPGTTYHFALYSYNATNCTNYFATAEFASEESGPGPGVYYSKSTGFLNDPANWGNNTDGSLSDPLFALTAFSVPNRQYVVNVDHPSATINGNWIVTGLNARVVVPNNATLTIPSSFTLTNSGGAGINVNNGGTLILENTTTPTYGTLEVNSNVVYNQHTETAIPTKNGGAIFGNLTLSGAGRKIFRTNFIGDTTIVMGNLTFNNVTYNTATSGLNSTRIRLGGNLTITGTVTRVSGSSPLDVNQSNNGYPNIICNVNGTNQTLSGNFANDSLSLFNLVVNKSSGSVTFGSGTRLFLQGGLTTNLSGTASFVDNGIDIYTTGNIQLVGSANSYNFTGTMYCSGGNGVIQNIRGTATGNGVVSAQLNNLIIARQSIVDFNGFAPSGPNTVTIKGNLTINSGSTGEIRLRENTYTLLGNFTNNRTSSSNITQTFSGAKIQLNGTTSQTFTNGANDDLIVAQFTVNNTIGSTINGRLRVQGTLTLNGPLDANGNTTLGPNFGLITGTNTTSSFRKLTIIGEKTLETTITVKDSVINNESVNFSTNGKLILGIGAVNGYFGGSSNNFGISELTSLSGSNWTIDKKLEVRGAVNVNGTITSDSGSLTLSGGSTYQGFIAPIAIGAAVNGTVTLEKWVNPTNSTLRGAYSLMGHPFNGSFTYSAYNTVFNPMVGIPGSADPNNPSSSIWLYNPVLGWVKPTNLNNNFPVASGAYIFLRSSVYLGPQRFQISGTVNNVNLGSINFPVSYTGPGSFNLLGNPLPAAIDWLSPSITKTSLSNTVYYWRHQIQGYASYTIGGGSVNGGSNIIPSGQGFFVEATGPLSAASITSESVKVTSSGTFFRTGNTTPQYTTKITLGKTGSTITDETIINFMNNASDNFSDIEPDGKKMLGLELNISSVTPAGESMVVNSRSLPTVPTSIPLNVTGRNAGTYTLNFDDLGSLPTGMTIFLEDAFTSLIQPIYRSSSYIFSITSNAASQGTNRFRLVFVPQTTNGFNTSLVNTSVNVFPNPSNGYVNVSLNGFTDVAHIAITDVMGRVVRNTNIDTQNDSVVKLNGLTSGSYLVKIVTGSCVMTKKLIVK